MAKKVRKMSCPSCLEENVVGFNWKLARKGKFPELNRYASGLKLDKELKFGEVYSCQVCETKWFLNDDKAFMEIMPTSQIEIVEEWNSRNLTPSRDIVSKLKKIGATPPDIFGNMSEFIDIPCRCTTKDGRNVEMCLVRFQKKPPLDEIYKEVIFMDDVADIFESACALSPKVRVASSNADEVSMGFAPVFVQSRTGDEFILNWTQNFFEMSGYRGKDIVLGNEKKLGKHMPPIYHDDPSKITLVVADWSRRFLKLRLKRRRVYRRPPLDLMERRRIE